MFFTTSMILLCIFYVFGFYKKKMIILLILELGALIFIYCYFFDFSGVAFSYFIMMVFMVFMILESVFNLSLLIAVSRNSTYGNPVYYNF